MREGNVRKLTSEKTVNEIAIRLPSYSVNEAIARATVAAFCAQLDPTANEIADIKCAVSEAVTNAIVHGYRDTIGIVYISVKICENRLIRIEIKDRGCGIEDVKQARQPLYTTDSENERSGMGFTVMESFCDYVRVWSKPGKGTRVTLFKRIQMR